jgi:S-adenosylmethionine hydrolase
MPIITLLTDFGTSDHFVGAMKAVILGIAPRATIVDITHDVAPYAIAEAAFVLGQAWTFFPKGTIHVAVVDPGVGSERRPILAEAGGHHFIAPDNGVLSMVYETTKHTVRVNSNTKMML